MGALVVLLLWLGVVVVGGAVAAECLLQIKSALGLSLAAGPRQSSNRFDRLVDAYTPFLTEHLHPQYVFFFPLTAAERMSMGNQVCSLDREAFREPGPQQAGGRRLAFLLGGSTAFGLFASSNDQTIAAHLNRLQSDYFFVSAGVPGFNSTQELLRLLLEVVDHKPALVIAFDGWNDITLGTEPTWMERDLPPGTPEGFPILEEMVRSAQSPWRSLTFEKFFPELTTRFNAGAGSRPDTRRIPDRFIDMAASRYNANLERMSRISALAEARFVSVFQPLASLHRSVPRGFATDEAITRFHQQAIAHRPGTFESHDLGAIFDEHFTSTPVMEGDLQDDTVFIDDGHLYDPGNAIVAQRLLQIIRAGAPAGRAPAP